MFKKAKKAMTLVLALALLVGLVGCGAAGGGSTAGNSTAPQGTTDENTVNVAVAGQPDPNKVGETVIQIGHANPGKDDDFYNKFCTLMSDHLYDLSGGKYSFEVFADCQLGGERDMYEGLQMGTLDAALITTTAIEAFVPSYTVTNLPFLFDDYDDVHAMIDDETIMGRLNDGCYATGVKVLGYGENGFRKVLNYQKSINTMDDLKGMKIRAPESATYIKALTAMGASPTAMAFNELFTGLQQKTVDGLELPIASIYTKSFYEVANYLSGTDHMFVTYAVCLSADFWDKLSEEEQGWFQTACNETVPELRAFVQTHEQGFLDAMIAKGVVYNEVSGRDDMVKVCRALYPEFKDTIGEETYNAVMAKLNIT